MIKITFDINKRQKLSGIAICGTWQVPRGIHESRGWEIICNSKVGWRVAVQKLILSFVCYRAISRHNFIIQRGHQNNEVFLNGTGSHIKLTTIFHLFRFTQPVKNYYLEPGIF